MTLIPPKEKRARTAEEKLFSLKCRMQEILRLIDESDPIVRSAGTYSHAVRVVIVDLMKEFED